MTEKKTQEQIVAEASERIKKEKDANAKKATEARDADAGKSTQKPKTKEEQEVEAKALKEKEATKKREEAEAQVKEDKRILETPEDKLNDEEKKRKVVLLDIKTKEDAKVKEKTRQDKIDKRIGELTGELKDMKRDKGADKEKITSLKEELKKLKGEGSADAGKDEEKKAEESRITKYTEEDKDKPREERREMTDEELNDWLVEDYVGAQKWMTRQEIRRDRERGQYVKGKKYQAYLKELNDKQSPHVAELTKKHPELDVSKRQEELKKEGKSAKEIHEILCGENEKYKLMTEILAKNPDILFEDDGPKKLGAELEKVLKPSKKEDVTDKEKKKEEEDARKQKELDDAVEAEIKRREEADANAGPSSSRAGDGTDVKSDFDKEQERLGKKVGISPERLAKARKRIKDRQEGAIV